MAKDSRRAAVGGLHTECGRRGRLCRSTANGAQGCARAFTSNEVSVERQDASTEEVIHAGHFSHSGCFA